MSWSFHAIGKPAAVAAKAAEQLSAMKCSEPEETIKNNVAASIVAMCEAMPTNSVVRVEANGSQHSSDGNGVIGSVAFKIDPVYGFVE